MYLYSDEKSDCDEKLECDEKLCNVYVVMRSQSVMGCCYTRLIGMRMLDLVESSPRHSLADPSFALFMAVVYPPTDAFSATILRLLFDVNFSIVFHSNSCVILRRLFVLEVY